MFNTLINHSAAALSFFSWIHQVSEKIAALMGSSHRSRAQWRFIYLALCARDENEENEDGDKEADGQVQVDGGPRTLDGADQGEGQDAEEEADQWEGQTHPGHQLQVKLVLFTEKSHAEGQESAHRPHQKQMVASQLWDPGAAFTSIS